MGTAGTAKHRRTTEGSLVLIVVLLLIVVIVLVLIVVVVLLLIKYTWFLSVVLEKTIQEWAKLFIRTLAGGTLTCVA